jgi:hypothetical protein
MAAWGHGLSCRRTAGASAWPDEGDEGDEKRRGGAPVKRDGRPRDEGWGMKLGIEHGGDRTISDLTLR